MFKMIYALEERIGQPEMFYGRKAELDYFFKWIDGVPKKLSKSTAILSRRKKGKTALVERLYNIIYSQNRNIVPFYYEVKEAKFYLKDIAIDFYYKFVQQYIGFKTRKIEIIRGMLIGKRLKEFAFKNNLDVIANDMENMNEIIQGGTTIDIVNYAFSAPHRIAGLTGEYIVQIIDEFQYLNKFIYESPEKNEPYDLAGIYMSLAESKIAPVIATGSWVNWLKQILRSLLPARFNEYELKGFTEEEGVGAVLNYSEITGVPVTEDTANIIARLAENDPYYISDVIRSDYKEKDLTEDNGILDTVEYEVTKGNIYYTWMEYIVTTFNTVNNVNAKKIVLFLANNRNKHWSIKEIISKCNLDITENECEEKLQMLVKGDLINEEFVSSFYSGLDDGILARVLRAKYSYQIDNIETALEDDKLKDIETISKIRTEFKKVRGQLSYHQGHAVEYYITLELRKIKSESAELLKNKVENYQEGLSFKPYKIIQNNYFIKLSNGENREIDIWAESQDNEVVVIECKKSTKKIGVVPVEQFLEKVHQLKQDGYNVIPIFYSEAGFTNQAEVLMNKNNIMWTYKHKWKE